MSDKPLLVDRHMCPYCQRWRAYKRVKVNNTARWMCDPCIDMRQSKGKSMKIIGIQGSEKAAG